MPERTSVKVVNMTSTRNKVMKAGKLWDDLTDAQKVQVVEYVESTSVSYNSQVKKIKEIVR